MKKLIILTVCMAVSFVACKKSGNTPTPIPPPVPPPPVQKTYLDFLKNTEWVGTNGGGGGGSRAQYPEPVDMKFRADSSITIYSLFAFLSVTTPGEVTRPDSINGKIIKIDSVPGGEALITANFREIGGDQLIHITDKNKLMMSPTDTKQLIANGGLNGTIYDLSLFPVAGFSVNGTEWSGAISQDEYKYQYVPDLSTITFGSIDGTGKGVTHYTRNGLYIKQGIGDGGFTVAEISYQQPKSTGARIYMFGYNEDYSTDSNGNNGVQGRLVPYFGVLLPSGDKMLVSSHSAGNRLPYYSQTYFTYGPRGTTPVIYKK